MDCAEAYLKERGYEVSNTSATQPYDFRATRSKESVFVEVKGTSSPGDQINLTEGEVQFALQHPTEMVLFVQHHIQLQADGDNPVASGSDRFVVWPWRLNISMLKPVSCRYRVR